MKLVSLTVSGYRQFLEQTRLDVPSGLIGICGPNGVGKSKLIEAIGYALYGPASAILPHTDRAADLAAKAGKAIPRVELEIEIRGQHYIISRTTRGTTSIQLNGAVDTIADGASAVTQKVIELLRLSADTFCGTFVARQNEVIGLQSLNSTRRRQVVNRLIGITQVEHAIQLVKETKANRSHTLEIAHAKRQMSSDAAQQQLDMQQAEREAAIEARAAQERELQVQEKELQMAQAQWDVLERRKDQVTHYQQVIEQLVPLETAAARRMQLAQERWEKVQAAARNLALAEEVLQQTDDVLILLPHYDLLARRQDLFQQQQLLDGQLAQRAKLTTQLQELNATIEDIVAKIDAYETAAAQAEAEARQARSDAEKQERQRETVMRLGPDGVCDVCGQVLGEAHQQALQRHLMSAEHARNDEHTATVTAQAARNSRNELRQERTTKEKFRDDLVRQHARLDTVPDQVAEVRHDLAQLDRQIAMVPLELRAISYDPVMHESLRHGLQRREEAVRVVDQQRTLATQEAATQQEVTATKEEIVSLQRQREDLEERIASTLPSDEEEAAAITKLTAVQETYKSVKETLRDRINAVVTAEERVRRAIEDLEHAQAQEQRIAIARRALYVAEQTEQALQQLLLEITAEARPRIVELMETWMRALLGPRFQTIELTDDYQLIANNGSGRHPIGHFSGGEQTLLAIMLRVAISIFCRERAGFDTSFLVLDEVFGNQDAEHRQQLIDFLNEIKSHYHQILIVNHIEDVTAMLDNIIDVIPSGNNMSRVQLR